MNQLIFQAGQQVFFCLLCGVAGNLFQNLKLICLDLVCFFELAFSFFDLVLQSFFFLFQVIQLAVDRFFLLLYTAFQTLNLVAALFYFLVGFGALLVDFVLCLDQRLFLFNLCVFNRIADDTFCFFFGGAKLCFGYLFAILDSQWECNRNTCCQGKQNAGNITDNGSHECFFLLFCG